MGEVRDAAPPFALLAIDTSLGGVSVCLLLGDDNEPAAAETILMERGHAEALLPMVDRVIATLDGGFAALTRVAVATGPGSFTGIRVGVSAARAFGLACGVPVVGVSTLAALAAPAIAAGFGPTIAAAVDAHHGNVYVQSFSGEGETRLPPAALSAAAAIRAVGPGPVRLIGSGAPMLAIEAWSAGIEADIDDRGSVPDIRYVARLGRLMDPARARPQPFYLKPPDAKPQTGGILAHRS